MQIPVLIERVAGNGYQARCGEPIPLCVEGATRDEALNNLQHQLQARLCNGAELAFLDLPDPTAEHPLAKFAGMF